MFNELISGRVEVQSSARRSYRAGVMPTEALLALGILKLTSRILEGRKRTVRRYCCDCGFQEWVAKLRGVSVKSVSAFAIGPLTFKALSRFATGRKV